MPVDKINSADQSRKAALDALRIMDTEPESRFDRFTRLASRLFSVPICAVTLLDDRRQWFKSAVGLSLAETTKNDSFCQHALGRSDITEVPDTLADVRFKRNPYVLGEPYIRFYAGAPISTPDGIQVGTLCLMDTTPRRLTPEQRDDLFELARLVEKELAVGDLNDTIAAQQRRMQVFAARKREAEAASRAKSEFLARMSHEIRTPMNGMLGMLELLEGAPLGPAYRRYLEVARSSGDLLLALINDILDLSSIEAGKMVFRKESFDLRKMMENVEALLAPLAREKELLLTVTPPTRLPQTLVGDAQRLNQILLNLIGNAIKYTEHGRVNVRVQVTDWASDTLKLDFHVRDTGQGIPVAERESVFEAFTQLTSAATDEPQGTGLGLPIAQRLAEGMGGAIKLDSQVGEGSVFTLTLPFGCDESRADGVVKQTGGQVSDATVRSCRILVAEDDPASRLVAKSLLERDGHAVTAVARGDEALELAIREEGRFDLIVLDVEMPGLTGPEVAERLRQRERENVSPRARIAVLTAHAMKGDRERFLGAGLDGYLEKPLRLEELRALVRSCIAVVPPVTPNAGPESTSSRLLPDEAHLLDQFGGDQALLAELMQTLYDSLIDRHAALQQAWATGDTETLRREVHSLKGMFGNMAMQAAREYAADLENALQSDWDAVQERFRALDQAIDAVCQQLAPVYAPTRGSGNGNQHFSH